jgi:hypothetical protein
MRDKLIPPLHTARANAAIRKQSEPTAVEGKTGRSRKTLPAPIKAGCERRVWLPQRNTGAAGRVISPDAFYGATGVPTRIARFLKKSLSFLTIAVY